MPSDVLAPYLSVHHRAWLAAGGPRRKCVDGTLLFFDISGFTPLTERLADQGKVGGEELTDHLNAVFAALLGGRRAPGRGRARVRRRRPAAAVHGRRPRGARARGRLGHAAGDAPVRPPADLGRGPAAARLVRRRVRAGAPVPRRRALRRAGPRGADGVGVPAAGGGGRGGEVLDRRRRAAAAPSGRARRRRCRRRRRSTPAAACPRSCTTSWRAARRGSTAAASWPSSRSGAWTSCWPRRAPPWSRPSSTGCSPTSSAAATATT